MDVRLGAFEAWVEAGGILGAGTAEHVVKF